MAENLVAHGLPILHTYSKYANQKIDTSFIPRLGEQNSLDRDIEVMQNRELAFYKKYGANTFDEFKQKIMKVFSSKDLEVLRRFQAQELQSALASFALSNKELYEYKEGIKLIIDTSKINNIKGLKLSSKNLQDLGVKTKGKDLELELSGVISVGKLKDAMNKLFGRHFREENFTATQYLDRFVTTLTSEDGPLTIQIGRKGANNTVTYSDEYTRYAIPNFPWGVTKQLWEDAVNSQNRSLLNEMDKATYSIYQFLQETQGKDGSKDMHQAIENVWNSLYGSDFGQARFFAGGKKNFISAVQGAMGEFQTALLFEYLSLKGMGNAFAEIKGNTLVGSSGEQARTDVEIFKSIGIQVKNFITIEQNIENNKQTSYIHDIHTRIHPDKLAKNFDPAIQDSFLSFLANFYFNASYEQQNFSNAIQLRYALENWLGSAMNMAIKDATEEAGSDVVTFYMFSGKNFVPCSVILQAAKALGLQNSLKIYSSYTGLTDKQYARSENGIPVYKKYWTKNDGVWQATDDNVKESKNLISSRVSIQTSFNYFDNIEKYALW